MAKVEIIANAQPEEVVVTTDLTPAMFPAAEAVVELKNEKGEGQKFWFGLQKSGTPSISTKTVSFVGTKDTVKLVARAPMSAFGATPEKAAMALGNLVDNVNALEAQVKADYEKRKAAAAKVVVVRDAEATAE